MKFYTNVFKRGNAIFYRGLDGIEEVKTRINYKPKFYVKSEEKTPFKSLDGHYLRQKHFDTIKDAMQYIELNHYYGMENIPFQFITQKFPDKIEYNLNLIKALGVDIETKSDDGFPEPEKADQEVTAITLRHIFGAMRKYVVFGLKDYNPNKHIVKDLRTQIEFIQCDDEMDLLRKFMDYWSADYPDIITGWNTRFFDIPYLINRINRLFDNEEAAILSPFRLIYEKQVKEMTRTRQTYDIKGISHLDYMELFKKFGTLKYGPQETFKLDNIAEVVLGQKKVDYSQYGTLTKLYNENYQLFIDYNIVDVDLIYRFEKETGLLALAIQMAYKAGCNYEDTLGTVGIWDQIIYRELYKMNVIPPKNKASFKTAYPGGYVKPPKVGMSNWVVSVDLASLYPNEIVQYNMSPETIITAKSRAVDPEKFIQGIFDINHVENEILTATGTLFRKDKVGIIPKIIKEYYAERKMVKAKQKEQDQIYETTKSKEAATLIAHYETLQMSIKILMNSLYGAMGSQYFRYFNQEMAEAITMTGQMTIKYAEKVINDILQKIMKDDKDRVIAMDTDSCYFTVDEIVKMKNPKDPVEFIDNFCKQIIEPQLAKKFDELAIGMNCIEQRMDMEREVIADKGIWIAKKRYILNMLDKEGIRYATPKLKMMGIEAVKSSTPKMVKETMKETFNLLMNNTEEELKDFIAAFKEKFYCQSPDKIAQPRGVNGIEKWNRPNPKKGGNDTVFKKNGLYGSGTPINVRASILYNHLIDTHGLTNKYEKIRSGDKIKYVFLKTPNPIHENIIALKDDILPEEFGLHQFIDYYMNYEKTFNQPMAPILDATGYDFSNQVKLVASEENKPSDLFSLFV